MIQQNEHRQLIFSDSTINDIGIREFHPPKTSTMNSKIVVPVLDFTTRGSKGHKWNWVEEEIIPSSDPNFAIHSPGHFIPEPCHQTGCKVCG